MRTDGTRGGAAEAKRTELLDTQLLLLLLLLLHPFLATAATDAEDGADKEAEPSPNSISFVAGGNRQKSSFPTKQEFGPPPKSDDDSRGKKAVSEVGDILLPLSPETETLRRKCKCFLSVLDRSGSAVICRGFKTRRQLCLTKDAKDWMDSGMLGAVDTLILRSSPLFSLSLTRLLLSRLGVDGPTLRLLRISNTSLANLTVCREREEEKEEEEDKEGAIDCRQFARLSTVDVRDNELQSISRLDNLPQLKTLYLSGNHWACFKSSRSTSSSTGTFSSSSPSSVVSLAESLSWMLEPRVHSALSRAVAESGLEAVCARPRLSDWLRNVTDKVPEDLVEDLTLTHFVNFSRSMSLRCPSLCSCRLMTTVPPLIVKVLCRNATLEEMPPVLPENTRVIDLSYNRISSLHPVTSNPAYRHLEQLYARGNRVMSLSDLAGSPFMRKNLPTAIDLRENQLQKLDTDLLGSVLSAIKQRHFQKHLNFFFGANPWDCACEGLQQMQQFIYQYEGLLRDSQYLACGRMQDPVIIAADYEQLCRPASFDYLSIVVVIEIILLVLTISKLVYDIVMYKRTGELPWLARHICLGYSYAGLVKPGENRRSFCQDLHCFGKDKRGSDVTCHRGKTAPDEESTGTTLQKKSGGAMQLLDSFRPRRHTSSSSGRKKSSSSLVSPDHGGRGGSGAIRPLDTFVDNSYSATTRDKRTERSKGTSSNCSNGVGALRRLCQDEETLGLSETWEEGAV